MEAISLAAKCALFSDHWSPKIIAELNGSYAKLVKIKGEFTWHKHDQEDELFLVVKGSFVMQYRERSVTVKAGELVVVPRGVEHNPKAQEECHILLLEPKTTLNTGDRRNEFTKDTLGWI